MQSSAVPRSPGDTAADLQSPFNLAQQQAAFDAQQAASLQQQQQQQQQQQMHQQQMHQQQQHQQQQHQQQQQQHQVNAMAPSGMAAADGHEASMNGGQVVGSGQGSSTPSAGGSTDVDSNGIGHTFHSAASSATGEDRNSIAAITRIGSLLDRVTDLAQNARQSFLEGHHAQSSLCLNDLQRSLTEIGELGSRSLAQVNGSEESSSSSHSMERTSSLGHRRNLTESALKKRPLTLSTHDVDFAPFKTLRAQDGTPVNNPAPPPSAPPTLFEGASSAEAQNNALNAPVPPPSAPPFFSSAGTSGGMSAPQNTAPSMNAGGTSLPPMPPQQPHQHQQDQQQAMHNFFNTTPQHSTVRGSISESPAMSQSSFSFPYGSMGSSSSHVAMAQSTPPTPNPSYHSARSSFGSSITSQVTGNTSQSLQQMTFPSMPPSPQQHDLMHNFEDMPVRRNRLRSGSGLVAPSMENAEELADGGLLSSERGMSGANVPPELKARLDQIFFQFLEKVCSDVDYTDSKGEHLHQILTAKKMSRSSLASTSFKAFKFRIQAFTNAFHEEVSRTIGPDECSLKQTRAYLWTSNYIARFNESGVKEKSKGNHVWRVEARKNGEGRFEFREFKRKIIVPAQVAYHGLKWSWPLRIWDPQAPSTSIKAVFGAQNLPSWIRWKEGDHPVLYGTPDASCQSCQLHITAHYVARGHQQLIRLSATVDLQVAPLLDSPSALVMPDHRMEAIQDSEQTMEAIDLEQAESVIAPSQVAHVMSMINFPYTPPASMGQRPQYFAGESLTTSNPGDMALEQAPIRQPLPSAPLPLQGGGLQPHEQIQHNQIRELIARQEQAAATMQLNMPPVRRRMTDHQSQDQARQIRAQAQQQAQLQAAHMATTPRQQDHHQQQQQQQQEQQQANAAASAAAAGLMLGPASSAATGDSLMNSTMSNRGPMSNLTLTPMSTMPLMASTLPQMTANSNDPMLSPALPVGFDPIANEGARLAALQQQQQQQQLQEQAPSERDTQAPSQNQ